VTVRHRKVRASSSLEQNKTPFSRRKPGFSVTLLVVGVAVSSIMAPNIWGLDRASFQGGLRWRGSLESRTFHVIDSSDLASEWGYLVVSGFQFNRTRPDLRPLSTSITHSLCDQIFTKAIHSSTATNAPETAAHAIDFGPGALSGIIMFTSHNLDGGGIRIVVISEKGNEMPSYMVPEGKL
jgi:hypothetical protein